MKRRSNYKKRIHQQPKRKFEWLSKADLFKYLSFLLIFLFLISIPVVIKKLIKINKIDCTSQFGECPTELRDKLQNVTGRDYYVSKKYLDSILKNDIQVSSYLIQYKIPSTIKIDLSLKKPKFVLKSNNVYYLIDREGLILNMADNNKDLPFIDTNLNLGVGSYTDNKTKFALNVFEKMNFLYTITSSNLTESELKVVTKDNITVLFPLEGDIDLLVGSARIIFSRLNESSQGIRMEDVHEIDLRFVSPTLR